MKEYGIRQAKSHLSEIARAAAAGTCTLVTDNRKPVAMIGPPPTADTVEADLPPAPVTPTTQLSDAAAFRTALLSAPYPLELTF
jgi:antitoxin (DNA-binding transcriptional repressor) of toxin-antitoxin stability system